MSVRACIAAVLIFGFAVLAGATPGLAMGKGQVTFETANGSYPFSVEVTEDAGERAKGLMFRRDMDADQGMLFLYEEPQVLTMWMKNTYLSLDMVFVGDDWRVNAIARRTEPFSLDTISSNGPAIGVIELNAGTAKRIGLKVGDSVDYERQ